MTDSDLAVYVDAFERSGSTSSINWFRNLDRNWHLLADVDPIVHQPSLMVYDDRDAVAQEENLTEHVHHAEDIHVDPPREAGRDQPGDHSVAR